MKLRIFNRGKGWYVPCSNWQDKEDKAYMNVRFAHKDDPIPDNVAIENSGFTFTDIDVLEAKFECYQKNVKMTIFKYEPLLNIDIPQKAVESFNRNSITDEDFPWE